MSDSSFAVHASSAKPERLGIARLIAGYGAIACALPYLALKVVWIAGGRLGVADERVMGDSSMIALNVLTAGMDVVAIAIALAFTHRWGLRIPAWLVLPPVWVATGLLTKFVYAAPVAAVAQALASESVRRPVAGPVQPWVYAVVYTEFVGMGIGLMVAFVLYARVRWRTVFAPTTLQPGPAHGALVPLANSAALLAIAVGGLHLAWAFGSTVGVDRELAARRTIASHLINGMDAALMIAAAIGVWMLVYGIGRRIPFWIPLTLTWIGGGFLFAWGLWHMINVLGNTALLRGAGGGMVLLNLASLARLLAGLVIGLVTLVLLAERHASPRLHCA